MISWEENKIVLGDQVEDIVKLDVWFRGPTGLVPTRDLALKMHDALSIDVPFHMAFRPVPVALGTNGVYEELQ
jgi:hypothetical protein